MTDPPNSVKVETTYIILKQSDHGWLAFGNATARDATAAVRGALEGSTENSGTFVAVPARSWNPVKVTPKVETTLVIEDAS